MNYYFSKSINTSFSLAKEKVIEILQKEGFGILTEIDLQATFKKKLNLDFYKYQILGACNPNFAYQALQAEDKVGLMLPCNVIIQQKNEVAPIEISAIDPVASMSAIQNAKLTPLATAVREAMKKVIDSL